MSFYQNFMKWKTVLVFMVSLLWSQQAIINHAHLRTHVERLKIISSSSQIIIFLGFLLSSNSQLLLIIMHNHKFFELWARNTKNINASKVSGKRNVCKYGISVMPRKICSLQHNVTWWRGSEMCVRKKVTKNISSFCACEHSYVNVNTFENYLVIKNIFSVTQEKIETHVTTIMHASRVRTSRKNIN
jgi:hypothetical protein